VRVKLSTETFQVSTANTVPVISNQKKKLLTTVLYKQKFGGNFTAEKMLEV